LSVSDHEIPKPSREYNISIAWALAASIAADLIA